MGSRTEGFTINLTNTIELPELSYVNELARERNFEFGGGFSKVPPILEDLYYLYYQERDEADEFAFENHVFSKKTIAEEVLTRELTESEEAYYNYTLKFLQELNYPACPGYSPMDKALNTLMYMVHLSDKNKEGDTTSKNKNNKTTLSPEALNDLIQEMSSGVNEEGSEGKKGADKPLSKDVVSCVRDFLYDLSPSIANIYGAEKTMDMPINPRILRDIKTKSYLEDKVGLETALEKKLIVNNSSKKKRIVGMTDHTQMMKGNKAEMIMPGYDDKLAKKELTIKERVLPKTRKQVVTMLLDDSGSMGSIPTQSYVRAVLLNRLESVMDGKSELNFYLYESQRYGYKKVTNLQEAQDLFKDISLRRPSGGGTHIGRILQETIDEIAGDENYAEKEIIIVCDGNRRKKVYKY